MGWWRTAMWSDVRVAMMMMAEQRQSDEAARAEMSKGETAPVESAGEFGRPPPATVLALIPSEGVS